MFRQRLALAVLCAVLLPCVPAAVARSAAPAQTTAPTAAQLEALSGEYTDRAEPDTPLSFYVQDGKLFYESERRVPTELKPVSAVEFGLQGQKFTLRFSLDASGNGASVSYSDVPNTLYNRTGPAVHHLFHDYQRTEAMVPMRDGVKLHIVYPEARRYRRPASVPHPAHPLRLRRRQSRLVLRRPSRTGPRRLHLRLRRHPRPLQE